MLTTVVTLLLALAPGALLGFVAPRGAWRWAAWAAAPILTLGLIAVAMAWLPPLGLPNNATAVLITEMVLAGAAVIITRIVTRGRRLVDAPRVSPTRSDLAGASTPALIAVGLGGLLLGRFQAPPGWDGMNHALLTRNIVENASTAIQDVCTTGSTHALLSCRFYPLAADTAWAQAATISGGHISTAMTTWAAYLGPVSLVVAIYVAVRMFGGGVVVAGCAATATLLLGPLWASVLTGRIPEEVSPGFSVTVALLAAAALCSRHPVRLGLLAGLGFAGLALTHTYDVLFGLALAVAFTVMMRYRLARRRSMLGAGTIVASSILAVAPLASALLGAGGERAAVHASFAGDLGKSVTYWVLNPARYVLLGYPAPLGGTAHLHAVTVQIGLGVAMLCLLASPLCLVFDELRWARPWFVMLVGWTLVGIWTSTSNDVAARSFSSLWYGVPARLTTMILPVYGIAAVAGACAFAITVRRAATAPAIAAGVVGALLFLALIPTTWRPLHRDLASRTPLGPSYGQAFHWLQQHIPKGDVVAYDRNLEMMTWSYADYGVPVLFGIPPRVDANRRDYADRFHAFRWLANTPGVPASGCLVRKYRIAYVVTGRARVPGISANYLRSRLVVSPRLTLTYRSGQVRVYAVNALGRVCALSPPSG